MRRLGQGPIKQVFIRGDPVLIDTRTGHSLRLTDEGLIETIIPERIQERFCAENSTRTMPVTAPGETRVVTCCPKGQWDPKARARPGDMPGVCEVGPVPIMIWHKVGEAAEKAREFIEGTLQKRRAKSFREFQRAGAKIKIS